MSAATGTVAAGPGRSTVRQHAWGFWIVAYAFTITMAAGAVSTPLYVIYQQQDGFSPFMVTVIFAVYALGVVISLFLAGHLSDRFGRRRIIVPAMLLNVLAMLLFLTSTSVGMLLAARFVTGLGIGMLTATATAHMTELHAKAWPGRDSRRAEVVSTAANMGGIGLGPLISGVLAQYAPAPLQTPYLVMAFLLVIGLLAIVLVPESVSRIDSAWRYRPQRIVVPRADRGAYVAATLTGFVGFAMLGFFSSLAPSFLSGQLGLTSHALAGAVGFVAFGSTALFQLVTGRWARRTQYAVGTAMLAVGIALTALGIVSASLVVLLIGGFIAGGGVGAAFKAAIGTVISIAPARSRGEALAGVFLISYIGLATPVLALGAFLQIAPLATGALAFGGLLLLLTAVTAAMLRRSGAFAR